MILLLLMEEGYQAIFLRLNGVINLQIVLIIVFYLVPERKLSII